jgi:hypothetical protein
LPVERRPCGSRVSAVVILALLVALVALAVFLLAFLLDHETRRLRLAGDYFARLARRACQHLWAVLKPLAAFIRVYVEMVRHGGSRP